MKNPKQFKFDIIGLDCANCANKIERKINDTENIKEAIVDFLNKKIIVISNEGNEENLLPILQKIVDSVEENVKVSFISNNVYSNKSNLHILNSNKESNEIIKKIIIGSLLFITGFLISKNNNLLRFIIFFVSYIVIGGDVLITAFKNIKKGQVFDENFLMSIATIGAFLIGEYPEAVAVMLFYQLGEFFQNMAVYKSRNSIVDLMNIKPDYANLKVNNSIEKVSPESVKIGDLIIVKPGEKVPLDGKIIEGNSTFDTSTLTGESIPRDIISGDEVLSGYINISSLITIKVSKPFYESTISKILDLVENATSKKSKTEQFITKFARYYTPSVVIIALIIAFIPPFIVQNTTFSEWFYRALVFLVISCPCALVISIPLGFFGGIGSASKHGILIKGANYLEALNNVDTIVMDKTGTLTKGIFKVTEINLSNNLKENFTKNKLLKYVAHAESFSNHPIAKSIVNEYEKDGNIIDKNILTDFKEISGYGVKVKIEEDNIVVGNLQLMKLENILLDEKESLGTTVYIGINGNYIGNILIADEIKEDSASAIINMKDNGIKNITMLTGDTKNIGESIAKKLNIDKVYAELLPHQKVEKLEDIFKENNNNKNKIAFVGDGINDAPVLARADIGIAMGGLGSDAAIEAADIVIMNDEPSKIVTSIKIAKNTRKIVWQNITFTLIIKIIVLILGAGGIASIWEAVFADVGVALLAILNATRIIKKKFD
ncbi:MAG: cadmium-translocating P-type ATPase [Leptotrichiaceae bacterium]|nr:cadmium-translocating P-type ATPase [Leptotrichiaceae bacterium]MBP9630549.1 cadmium-translocating P-type ATPase [Leptotrichiaceae bacterium]